MNPGAESFPGDVLLEIFSYLSVKDLVESVQFVCTRWKQVVSDRYLWKDKIYRPDNMAENIIQMLNELPHLRILHLTDVNVDNKLISFITDSCPNIEELYIPSYAVFNITHPMKQIKILSLIPSSILDFESLNNVFPNLESLNIAELTYNLKDLQDYLQKKKDSLHTLAISCCTADKLCILPCLSICSKLRNLSLQEICAQVLSCKEVPYFPTILNLTLSSFDMNKVSEISSLLSSFPNITALVLKNCSEAKENVFTTIASNCPQIQRMKISFYRWADFCRTEAYSGVPPDTIKYTLHLKRLTHLYLYNDSNVTNGSIEHLRLMPELIHLDLYQCRSVTTGCLKLICGFHKLEVLKFDLNFKQLPTDLTAIDVKNKNLQLMFYNCQDVSSLDSLRQQHLRVCQTEYSSCRIKPYGCLSGCLNPFCACWLERWKEDFTLTELRLARQGCEAL